MGDVGRRIAASLTALLVTVGVGWGGVAAAAEIPEGVTNLRIVEDAAGKFDQVTLELAWAAPPGAVAGDTITVHLPEVFEPVDNLSFPLRDVGGNTGATGVVTGRTMTITLGDYVETRVNVHGTARVALWLDHHKLQAGTPYTVEFVAGAATFTDTLMVEAFDAGGQDRWAHKWMVDNYRPDAPDHRLHWGVIGPRIAEKYTNATYIFTDYAQEGQAITCGEKTWSNIQLKLGDTYVDGSLRNMHHRHLRDVPGHLWAWECTPEQMTVTFDTAKYPAAQGLIPWVAGFSKVTDPALPSYLNKATVTVAGAYSQDVVVSAPRASGAGTVSGESPAPAPTPESTPTEPAPTRTEFALAPTPTPEPEPTTEPTPAATSGPESTPTQPAPEPTSPAPVDPPTHPGSTEAPSPSPSTTTDPVDPAPPTPSEPEAAPTSPPATTPTSISTTPPEPRPTPVSPTPSQTTAPRPAPTQTAPPRTTPPPARPKPVSPMKPTPAPKLVTRTFQVDRYLPATAKDARGVAALDNDGVLAYREDRFMWGKTRWQFVTVTVRADATHAQVMAAINATTTARVGDVNTARTIDRARAGRSYVIVWELGKGATTAHAWGRDTTVNQKFFARS